MPNHKGGVDPRGSAGPLGLHESCIDRSGECWLWTGGIDSVGYGIATPTKLGARRTHVRVWETLNGPVPTGLVVDHICHNGSGCEGGPTCIHRRCVRPDHLELTTRAENFRRGSKPGRKPKKECIRGHEFTEANTYVTPDGRRQCKQCGKLRSKKTNTTTQGGQ